MIWSGANFPASCRFNAILRGMNFRNRCRPLRLLLGVLAIGGIVLGCRMQHPLHTPPVSGILAPCPSSPNCVCSQDPDSDHQIAPLAFTDSPDAAWIRLKRVVGEFPRTRIVEERPDYLRAEFTTAILRFVDDVEFLMDGPGRRIQVRSASRVGHSDLGANRERVEQLRAAFETQGR